MKSDLMLACACELDIGKEGAFCVLGAASEDIQNPPEGAEKLYLRSAARWFCMDLQVMIMSQLAEIVFVASLLPC